ncbi:MAG: pentapeptide repeat protein [Nocardioides sp.]|nr:pentapeptide repeat protein [Nocardioides sp.]
MTNPTGTDQLEGAHLVEVSLRGTRFTDCDLTGVVMRSVELADVDVDAPWLFETETRVLVNGVDVVPLVRAELERRFPGRDLMTADDPDGLRAAWAAVEAAWAGAQERAAAMPAGTVDVSVDGEWSFAQTQRHLVLATDLWARGAVLGVERPLHPLGLADASAGDAGLDTSVFTTAAPTYEEVLEARADRVATVRDLVATVTADDLARPATNPWNPQRPETALSCLHTVLHEEWEHLRFAVRDLDAIEAGAS